MPRTLRQKAQDALQTLNPEPVAKPEPQAPREVTVTARVPFFWGNQLQPKGTVLSVPERVADVLKLKGLV
jgi:hypothetical protein